MWKVSHTASWCPWYEQMKTLFHRHSDKYHWLHMLKKHRNEETTHVIHSATDWCTIIWHSFGPQCTWNMDEGGMIDVQKLMKIIDTKGQRQISKMASGEWNKVLLHIGETLQNSGYPVSGQQWKNKLKTLLNWVTTAPQSKTSLGTGNHFLRRLTPSEIGELTKEHFGWCESRAISTPVQFEPLKDIWESHLGRTQRMGNVCSGYVTGWKGNTFPIPPNKTSLTKQDRGFMMDSG